MKIIPKRGLNIGSGTAPVHAPAGVAVEVPDALGRELIQIGVAVKAPATADAAPVVAAPAEVETAQAPAAPENASFKTVKRRK